MGGRAPVLPVSWRTEVGAKRAIVRLGGIEAATDQLFRRIELSAAQFGDIAGVLDDRGGFHVMLVEGQTLCSPGVRRLDRIPRREMIAAWSAEPRDE